MSVTEYKTFSTARDWIIQTELGLFLYEPVHNKTYNKTNETIEASDQPGHLRSLIRIIADHVPSTASRLSRGMNENPCQYWINVQADLSLLVTQVLL